MNLFDLYAKIAFDDGEYTSGVKRAQKNTSGLTQAFGETSKEVQTLRNKVGVLSSQYKEAEKNVEDITKRFNESAQKTGLASKETQELAQQLEEAEKKAREARSKLQQYNISLDDVATKSEKSGSSLKKFASTLGSGIKSAATVAAGAISVATTAIAALGKIAFDYNSEIESYTTNFEVMLGDAGKAAQMVSDLEKMGANTPFEMSDLASATQTLLAFNVAGDKTKGVLTKLGDISLGNTQKLESLTRAYGKMNASQKVTLEDINMMIDAGYNPLINIQDATGESMEQLYERISKGEVAFSEIEQAIDSATGAGGMYENGMQKASQTTQGLISTLKDNAQALVGKVFKPITDGLKNILLPGAIDAIQMLSDAYEEKGVEGMIDAAGEIVGAAVGELANNAPDLIESGVSLIDSLLGGIEKNLPAITKGAGDTFFTFVSGVASQIPNLFSLASDLVTNFGQYIIDNPDKVVESAGSILASFATGIVELLSDLSQTAVDVVIALGEYLVDHAGDIATGAIAVGEKIVYGIWDGIVGIWDSVINIPGLLEGMEFGMSVANGTYTGPSMTVNRHGGRGGSFAAASVHGSFAEGLSYVPFDGFIAELHKGERVLTAKEAKQYGGSKYIENMQVVINGIAYESMRELAQEVAVEFQNIVDERG